MSNFMMTDMQNKEVLHEIEVKANYSLKEIIKELIKD